MCHGRLFLDAGVYSERRRRALLRAAFLVLAVPSAICAPQRSRDLLHWHQPVRGSAGVASANGKFQRSACSVFLLLQRSQALGQNRLSSWAWGFWGAGVNSCMFFGTRSLGLDGSHWPFLAERRLNPQLPHAETIKLVHIVHSAPQASSKSWSQHR